MNTNAKRIKIVLKTIMLSMLFLQLTSAWAGDYSRSEAGKVMDKIPSRKERSPEKIAEYIADNVSGREAQAYAVYYYVAHALEYNFEQSRRVTLNASREEIVSDALSDRVGVCQHYAELYHAIAGNLGIPSIVVAGYTRQNGKIVEVPHAWNAIKIDGNWFLADPTWGSGYLTGKEYTQRYSTEWFMVAPEKMIKSHMPFDPMMQFLEKPLTHYQFLQGTFNEGKEKAYDLEATISGYFNSSDEERLSQQMKRIREHGIINDMTEKYYNFLNQNYLVHYANRQIDRHNEAVQILNEVVEDYNAYIKEKNNNQGIYPASKDQALQIINSIAFKTEKAKTILESINPTMKLQEKHYKNMQIARDLEEHLDEEKKIINKNM